VAPAAAQTVLASAPRKLEIFVGTEVVPIKTPEGLAELSTRQRRLSQRHRTLLHLVDGRRSEEQVRSMSAQAGVPDSCFGELIVLGLIELTQRATPAPLQVNGGPESQQHVHLPLVAEWRDSELPDSGLPALRTVPPSSAFRDSGSGSPALPSSWFQTDPIDVRPSDDLLERAREILLRTVRAEAPVAGTLTLLRLLRARSRAELQSLLDEVEARVGKPPRSLTAALALQQVRSLLARPRSAVAAR
jgi:hypothetical protein